MKRVLVQMSCGTKYLLFDPVFVKAPDCHVLDAKFVCLHQKKTDSRAMKRAKPDGKPSGYFPFSKHAFTIKTMKVIE